MAFIGAARIARCGIRRWQLSYKELNEAANRFAHRLIGHGFKLGDRVGDLDGAMTTVQLRGTIDANYVHQ
jgi:hypothetical protein